MLVYFSGDWDVHWGYDSACDSWPHWPKSLSGCGKLKPQLFGWACAPTREFLLKQKPCLLLASGVSFFEGTFSFCGFEGTPDTRFVLRPPQNKKSAQRRANSSLGPPPSHRQRPSRPSSPAPRASRRLRHGETGRRSPKPSPELRELPTAGRGPKREVGLLGGTKETKNWHFEPAPKVGWFSKRGPGLPLPLRSRTVSDTSRSNPLDRPPTPSPAPKKKLLQYALIWLCLAYMSLIKCEEKLLLGANAKPRSAPYLFG